MSCSRLPLAILAALLFTVAPATGEPADLSYISISSQPSPQSLGYGFGASLDRPFHEVGSQAVISVFFFNQSRQDVFGFSDLMREGVGAVSVYILDDKGRFVLGPCRYRCPQIAVVVGPTSLPSGTFLRFDTTRSLTYYGSETGDPDGAPLPGGLYTLKASQGFGGPGPGGSAFGPQEFPGGNPEARVPFRIYQCTDPAGLLPVRELAQGAFSGHRSHDPTFFGEDLVLRTGGAGLQFWQQHTSIFSPPPDPPAVDLSQETVLVSLLGQRPSSGFGVRILSVLDKPCHVEVIVQEGGPPPIGDVLPVITTPFDIVAIPHTLKEVVFVHQRASTDGIEAIVGQDFAIILDSNPTTGFRWQLAQPLDDTILSLLGSEFRPPTSQAAGAPGEEVWTFRAVGRGTTTISLKYVRPWETGVPPVRTATYSVVVR